ncbi:M15 family metallopeptidase [Chitiniphilus eburneus]|uniref:D-alanyl-D-alanine carboxypeptidase family protein n=1 Tax=Chitiniphilus eburneus TaxID=2571148 RepID=A0A4V5MRU9_9NEIS|nr:M15 family metallopeptidase [Chitiniphilus eburneus]TJZ77518.1 D-alanyl-D-alanine carboxypeptidase family protein [Chitiniphilus eburneus]
MNEALRASWAALGIPESVLEAKRLTLYEEAESLTDAETGDDGRVWQLTPAATLAWQALRTAAAEDGITLRIASAYRGTDRQVALIRRKLNAGQPIDAILQVLAPPGCSEHHTGRAIDIYMPGGPIVEEAFEDTPAFAWLQANAGRYGFTLSFPRDNRYGYVYEPWHWCFQPVQLA